MQQWLVSLFLRYMQGVGAIRPALLNCLLTCLAAAIANVAYDGWSPDALMSLTRRIVVGYSGAACMVVLVLPWLRGGTARRTIGTPLVFSRIFGRGSGNSSRS